MCAVALILVSLANLVQGAVEYNGGHESSIYYVTPLVSTLTFVSHTSVCLDARVRCCFLIPPKFEYFVKTAAQNIIPREARGYSDELFGLSVRPSVCVRLSHPWRVHCVTFAATPITAQR